MNNNDYKKILDRLVNDKNAFVHVAVAKQGYGLDKLVDDEDWPVCAAILD